MMRLRAEATIKCDHCAATEVIDAGSLSRSPETIKTDAEAEFKSRG